MALLEMGFSNGEIQDMPYAEAKAYLDASRELKNPEGKKRRLVKKKDANPATKPKPRPKRR